MTFLPEGTKEPVTKSYYTKLTEGTHKLRILSSAVVGWEVWERSGEKPTSKRYTNQEDIELDLDGESSPAKYFWAFVVWNYEHQCCQIMQMTQKTLRAPLQALVDDAEWGDPKGYNITITRTGTKLEDTEYTLMPNPHSELAPEIKGEYDKLAPNIMEKWMEGKDPFKKEDGFEG